MISTLLVFGEKNYYDKKCIKTEDIADGRYKSAFLAGLIAYRLLKILDNIFKGVLLIGIYRYHTLLVS